MLSIRNVSLIAALVLALVGCGTDGPELADVTGRVTLDGKPVPDATVTFVPQEGQGSPSYGHTDADGNYVMRYTFQKDGVMLGTHDITIQTENHSQQEIAELREAGIDVGEPVKVPGRYTKTGELTAEVERGDNEIDFKLSGASDDSQANLMISP